MSLRAQWRQLTSLMTCLFPCSTPHSPLRSRSQTILPYPLCRSPTTHLVAPRSHCLDHAPPGGSKMCTPAHPCGPSLQKGPPPVCLHLRKVLLHPCLLGSSCSHHHVCRNARSTVGSSSFVQVHHFSSSHLSFTSFHYIFEGAPAHATASGCRSLQCLPSSVGNRTAPWDDSVALVSLPGSPCALLPQAAQGSPCAHSLTLFAWEALI